jgi:hypothetical protein
MCRGNTDCQQKIMWKLQYANDKIPYLRQISVLRPLIGIIIRVTIMLNFSCTKGNLQHTGTNLSLSTFFNLVITLGKKDTDIFIFYLCAGASIETLQLLAKSLLTG